MNGIVASLQTQSTLWSSYQTSEVAESCHYCTDAEAIALQKMSLMPIISLNFWRAFDPPLAGLWPPCGGLLSGGLVTGGLVSRRACVRTPSASLCKNGWTDQDTVRSERSWKPKEQCVKRALDLPTERERRINFYILGPHRIHGTVEDRDLKFCKPP